MFRWGILSTAKIGRELVIPAIQDSENGVVAAIASRDLLRARALADRFGVPRAHGSYEALLADPEIDGVYVPLPTSQHVEWTIRAADAGKHVLCEKPLANDVDEAERMADAARRAADRGVRSMVGFSYRRVPAIGVARALAEDGRLGEIYLRWFPRGYY